MSASPFGFGPPMFGAPSPEELARALAQLQAGMPAGFSGTPSMQMPQGAAPMMVRPQAMGGASMPFTVQPGDLAQGGVPAQAAPSLAPRRLSFGGEPRPAQSQAPVQAGAVNVPLPPARPAEFQTAQADAPASGAQPIMAQGVGVPAGSGPSMMERFAAGLGRPEVYNTLIGIGQGLLTNERFGAGLAAGAGYASKLNAQSAATRVAEQQGAISRAKFGLEMQKAGRETQAANQTAKMIADRTGIPYEQALGLTGNKEFVNAFLSRNINAPEGWQRTQDGSLTFVPGGPQDPAVIRAQAEAKAQTAPVVKEFDIGGQKVPRVLNRQTGQWEAPDYGANPPSVAVDTDVPPGVDPATYRKEMAKATVAQQKAATGRAQVADNMMAVLDRAEKAYTRLGEMNAIGPYNASGFNRTIGGMFGAEPEVLRQEYEAASKELELAKAQISMKGQGTITDSERRILALTLPRLDAADASTGLRTLADIRRQYQAAVNGETLPTYGRGQGGRPAAGPNSAPSGAPAPQPQGDPQARYQQFMRQGMSKDEAFRRLQDEGF